VTLEPLIATRAHSVKQTGDVYEPWLVREAIEWLRARLNGKMRGLEWGCGTSTEWFCSRLGSLISVEHNVEWAAKVLNHMKQFPSCSGKWGLLVIPGSTNQQEGKAYLGNDGLFHKEYADLSWVKGPFDFICVDGRARNACLRTALRLLRRPGGVLVLDNAQRKKYNRAVIPAGWRKSEWNNGVWRTAVWEAGK
jgi:hypothetical protein